MAENNENEKNAGEGNSELDLDQKARQSVEEKHDRVNNQIEGFPSSEVTAKFENGNVEFVAPTKERLEAQTGNAIATVGDASSGRAIFSNLANPQDEQPVAENSVGYIDGEPKMQRLRRILIENGLVDEGVDFDVVLVAGGAIEGFASEEQKLRVVLLARGAMLPETSAIDAAIQYIECQISTPLLSIPEGRVLAAGTKLILADEIVTLAESAIVTYPNHNNEGKFAAMCAHTENFDANRDNLQFRYGSFGMRLDLAEQVDDPAELPRFIANLSESEAASFGIESAAWREHRDAHIES